MPRNLSYRNNHDKTNYAPKFSPLNDYNSKQMETSKITTNREIKQLIDHPYNRILCKIVRHLKSKYEHESTQNEKHNIYRMRKIHMREKYIWK